MPDDRTPNGPSALGRAGRGRAPQEPARLAAAGFLAASRLGGAGTSASELVDGFVCSVEPLREAGASAVRALGARLLTAVAPAAAGAAEGGGPGGPLEVVSRPLVRLGPEDVLRPALGLFRSAARSPHASAAQRLGAGGSWDPEEVVLVVEVAPGASARRRAAAEARAGHRLRAYARAAVREVWLLDVRRGWVEAYRSPWGGAFRSRTLWYPGEAVPVTSVPGLAVEALSVP